MAQTLRPGARRAVLRGLAAATAAGWLRVGQAQARPSPTHPGEATEAAAASTAGATPPATPWPEVRAALPQATLSGAGRLRVWGVDVYDATLWVTPGFQAGRFESSPLALSLVYLRRLRGAAIAEQSLQEMQRIRPLPNAQAQAWLATLQGLFPDVQAQDRLTGVHTPGGPVRFWINGRSLGSVVDAALGPHFFGIWLAPDTRAPGLRQALLGNAAP